MTEPNDAALFLPPIRRWEILCDHGNGRDEPSIDVITAESALVCDDGRLDLINTDGTRTVVVASYRAGYWARYKPMET